MPYAYISTDNKVIRTTLKISPFDKHPVSGERILFYTEPDYDPELDTISIVEPVGSSIEITLTPKANKLDIIKRKKAQVIQNLLDNTARQHGYDSMLSAVSYATDPDSIFYQESIKFSRWRSDCWATAFSFINNATIEDLLALTDEYIVANMPTLVL